ncbi:SDR family NAD(P)-dependent oxidoreductase [Mycobacterium sp. C31M]
MLDLGLDGRTVLVTGGSSGIGNGIARAFLGQGASVHVTGTRPNAGDYADEDGSDLGGMAYHQLDVSDADAVAQFSPGPAIDVLVNSVGTVAYHRAEYDPAVFARVVEVNLHGVMRCCVRFHDDLARAHGTVVNVGSTSSFISTPGQPAYGASKGALVTLTKSLADAWARDGIRVNGIAPGFVETKLTRPSRDRDDVYAATLAKIPLRRWGTPEEMGAAALFLASPQSSYITGQMLLVDGGTTLR